MLSEYTPETELDAVLDTMVDGVIMIDNAGLIQRYNPACQQIFGYDRDEVLGQNIRMLMPDPYRKDHDDYIANYQATGDAKIIGIGRDVQGQRKNGDVFPMYLSVGELPSKGSRAFVGIIRDLSQEAAQKKKYDQLQQSHFHLSRVAAMDQMGSAIAHELNQPLSAIMNYLQAGLVGIESGKAPDTEKLSMIMTKSSEQAERAARILSRLRRFIETGDTDKDIKPITDIVQTAIDLTLPSFKNSGIVLIKEIAEDLPQALVSDVQIQQVLVNLIRNACEAMADSPQKRLTVSVNYADNNALIVGISDTGKGMSDDEYEELYKPFSSTKDDGLGVGLSISQTIIANHEGRLWAERNTPIGTRFFFSLPVSGE
ncbi:nitrogen regulation protein NR(II) [Fretibacter rubidus]|uniref:two-component system sensor histidine kinase NtrB n=1 Tax=Fretibacter rubidus TaxID=570162 RepID=UPI00352A33C5